MKFKDAPKDEREPTGLIINDADLFGWMDNTTKHILTLDEELTDLYFKTKIYLVLFTIINLAITIIINFIMSSNPVISAICPIFVT